MVRSETRRSSASARAVVTPRRRRRCTIRKRRSARRTRGAILPLSRLEDADRGAGRIAQHAEDAVGNLHAVAHDLRAEIARPAGALRAIVHADVGEPSRDALEQLLGEGARGPFPGVHHEVHAAGNLEGGELPVEQLRVEGAGAPDVLRVQLGVGERIGHGRPPLPRRSRHGRDLAGIAKDPAPRLLTPSCQLGWPSAARERKRGGLRALVARSYAEAMPSRRASDQGRPTKLTPTGSPEANAAGTVTWGYPATAAGVVKLPALGSPFT